MGGVPVGAFSPVRQPVAASRKHHIQLYAEPHLTLYLVRRLSHFFAICSAVSLPSRPRPFKMVLGTHTGRVSRNESLAHEVVLEVKA